MKLLHSGVALAVMVAGWIGAAGTSDADVGLGAGYSTRVAGLAPYAGDEFDGPDGAPPDPARWNIRAGAGGWGNKEQQDYTPEPANVRLDGDGSLIITTQDVDGRLTSARIDTDGKERLESGIVAARIKLPEGQGLHPAFWMLGESLDEVGYPECGEIDIIETVNRADLAFFSVHGPMREHLSPKWKLSTSRPVANLSNDYHIYWVDKRPGRLIIGIDDEPMALFEPQNVPTGSKWVQDAPFFVLLNVAAGGEWPGPVGDGVLPATMSVDWVRFYR
jgi:beta-glucanase (GH16 family)